MDRRLHSRSPSGNAHGGRLVIFGAAYDSIAAKLEIGAQSAREFENNGYRDGRRENNENIRHNSSSLPLEGLGHLEQVPGEVHKLRGVSGTPYIDYLFWRTGCSDGGHFGV